MPKLITFFVSVIFIVNLTGCTSNNSNIQALKQENIILKQENETLKKEIDEIKYGAGILYSQAENFFNNKSYEDAKATITTLKEKHPDSDEAKKAENILNKIKEIEQKEQEALKLAKKQKADSETKRLAEATKKMRRNYDEVQETTWYYDKSSPEYINRNGFYIYIGTKKDEKPCLLFKIQYAGDNWVFINKYILKVDDQSFEIDAGDFGVKRDNGNSGVWEYYDITIDKPNYEIIKAVISSKKTILRYQGNDHYFDRIITSQEKKALQNVLDAYKALGGSLNF